MRGAHISHSGIRGDQFAALVPVRERVSGPAHAGTVCACRELARSTRQVVAADQAWPVPPGRLPGWLTGGLVTVIDYRLAEDGDGPVRRRWPRLGERAGEHQYLPGGRGGTVEQLRCGQARSAAPEPPVMSAVASLTTSAAANPAEVDLAGSN